MSRPLKIWLPAIRAGSGADVFVLRLAQALTRVGHEPHVDWFDHRYELMPWRLASMAIPDGMDIVHANSWQGFAFKRPGIPLVITEHQYVAHPAFAPYQGRLQHLYHRYFVTTCMRRSFKQATAIVAVSEYIATAMREDLIDCVSVVHNWIDTDHFSPSASNGSMGVSNGPIKLLFVGNPSRWKGANILPRLALMLGNDFEIHCLGGLRKEVSARRGFPSNIKLLPRVIPEEMPSVYRAVDMALVPARYEGFGYVALEAMACGLPVLGFDTSGTAEVCVHGETALLSPVDNVDQLAAYARQLAGNYNLMARLGAAGRRRAVEYFNENGAASAYLEIYQRAIAVAHV